jgi:hypothetical protein
MNLTPLTNAIIERAAIDYFNLLAGFTPPVTIAM